MNGAPPIFGATKVTGSVEIDLPAGSGQQEVREALAKKLGVEAWQIRLPVQTRRAAQTIKFELVVAKDQVSELGLEGLGVKYADGDTTRTGGAPTP